MTLYIFNPEHDYALANNEPHFVPPASAVKFAHDCAPFLRHIVPDDGVIYLPYSDAEPFLSLRGDKLTTLPGPVTRLQPWGWDPLVLRQCKELLGDNCPADNDNLSNIRKLAHRRKTIEAHRFLQQEMPDLTLPEPAQELFSVEEMRQYVEEHHDVIFKSPYSGNGRGHLYAHGECSPTLIRQGSGVIRRQGSIMAEPLHKVVQDFAMEFKCDNGQAAFSGYSLFSTRHYGYAGNLLVSDENIEKILTQWVSQNDLHLLQNSLTQYIERHIAPQYDGFLGVDMFIYQQDNEYKLNPMVEMNLRMTMGIAAHILYERFVHPGSQGTMQLEYSPKAGSLQEYATHQPSPTCQDGRWYSGFFSLTPIEKDTQYAITVNINPL